MFNLIISILKSFFGLKKQDSVSTDLATTPVLTTTTAAPITTSTPAPAILSSRVDRSKLYPPFVSIVGKFELKAAKIGGFLFDGFRSFDDQMAQYQKGRKLQNGQWVVVDSKLIVTKAQPGMSFHNYGVAIDMAFDADMSKQGIQWTWDDKMPWKELGNTGKSFGLEWAGDWITFPELAHFQMTYGYKIHQLYDVITTAKTLGQGLLECWKLFDKKQN